MECGMIRHKDLEKVYDKDDPDDIDVMGYRCRKCGKQQREAKLENLRNYHWANEKFKRIYNNLREGRRANIECVDQKDIDAVQLRKMLNLWDIDTLNAVQCVLASVNAPKWITNKVEKVSNVDPMFKNLIGIVVEILTRRQAREAMGRMLDAFNH